MILDVWRGALLRADLPLCVDLDGTLIYSDTLLEAIATQNFDPRLILALLKLPIMGRAAFKHRVANWIKLEPALLPYNRPLIDYLKSQKQAGRYLVLATGSNRAVAEAVMEHLGLFDEVIASSETCNVKGRTKAEALCARFGQNGFVYAGNDKSDIAIWRKSGAAILVNTSPGLARRVHGMIPVEATVPGHPAAASALLRAMRPHQWIKNLLVFVPIITAHATGELTSWIHALLAFAAFCTTASAIYLINDATDLIADRKHQQKRLRPFASGALSLQTGLLACCALLLLGTSFALASGASLVILTYAVMSISYSLKLKELPLVDVFFLGALYTIRIYGGGVATGHELSLWLLAFSGFLFLGLAILKRVAELSALRKGEDGLVVRRGYSAADLPVLEMFGCAASFASSLVLALFVQREATAGQYASPILLWGTVPIILFWQCRLWLSTARGYMRDDPIVYSAHDWVSWIVGLCVFFLLLLAFYVKL